MKIDKLTEQILEITNNSDYGWIHSDSVDAERIRVVLSKALSLVAVVGRSEQLKAISDLKDFAYEVCPLHREDDLEEIIDRL